MSLLILAAGIFFFLSWFGLVLCVVLRPNLFFFFFFTCGASLHSGSPSTLPRVSTHLLRGLA